MPSRLALLRVAGLYRQHMELAFGTDSLRNEPLFALSPLYADLEALRQAWIVASQFEGNLDAARHEGLERIRHDAPGAVRAVDHLSADTFPAGLLHG